MEFDLICIGSGPAGQRAAVQAAKVGKRVAIIEKQRAVGGVCIETGTIPSKTFREAVHAFRRFGRTRERTGVTGPRPSIKELLSRVDSVIRTELDVVHDQLTRNGIEVVPGKASFVDSNTVRVDALEGERRLTGSQILIAVGTNPARPRGKDFVDGKTVVTSDGLLNIEALPRSMVVVGGGIIGIEYASMFAQLGVNVTLIDKRSRPLEFVDFEIVDELVHQMRKHHVTFRFGEAVASVAVVEGPPRCGLIQLESGKRLVADLVLYSVGRQGATADLGLENIGVEPDNRGRITVNEDLQTSTPNVYAAGDVIGYPALAATSSEQGRRAACHMFSIDSKPMGANFPVGIYAIPEISMVGRTEEELTEARIPYETGVARYREIARGQILGDESGLLKLLFHRDDRTLLGVHVIGSGATELIHIGQAVLGLGGGLDYFMDTVFNYPTLAECYKVAAYNAANKLRVADLLAKTT